MHTVLLPETTPLIGHIDVGQKGEQLAAQYLTNLGWQLLARNWRPTKLPGGEKLRGELDLVAAQPLWDADGYELLPLVVIVEVKTRTSTVAGMPAAAVTPTKLLRLQRLAQAWLACHELPHSGVRLDVISILLDRVLPAQLRHHRGVSL